MNNRRKTSNNFGKTLNFFLNNEPDVSDLPSNTNFAFAVHSNQNEVCSQSTANGQPHYHVLIEVTKECTEAVNKMTLNLLSCLASFHPLNA